MDDDSPDEPGTPSQLSSDAGDRPFSRAALVLGVGLSAIFLIWTVLRTYSAIFPSFD